MDATQYGESQYLTPTIVNESQQAPDKIGVIVSDVEVEDGKFGKQLSIKVSFDQKIKVWKMNKESVKNMLVGIGKNTELWLTKKVKFSVTKTKDGKDKLLGSPLLE